MFYIETSQYRSVFAIIQYNSMLFFLLGAKHMYFYDQLHDHSLDKFLVFTPDNLLIETICDLLNPKIRHMIDPRAKPIS